MPAIPGPVLPDLPLYQAFGDVSQVYNSSGYLSSNYNSLQIAVNRQFSNGLMLKGAYTWSHAINFTDDDGWAEMTWYGDQFPRNRATAGYDRTQVFQLGWVYELPFGTGKPYLNTGLVSKIIGGWQFSGIESCYTGLPYTVTASGTSLNAPDQTQTANQVGPVQFIGGVGPGAFYYNPGLLCASHHRLLWQCGAQHFAWSGSLEYRCEHRSRFSDQGAAQASVPGGIL